VNLRFPILLCSFSSIVYAPLLQALSLDLSEILEEVVVTATRTSQTVDETLASVTVIDRQQIEHHQSLTLPELLRTISGLDIVSTGGLGKVSSMLIRGSETDHVLVLVDGMKIGSATLGTVSFQDIPLANIERIEIVKGPRSSLYGSEAIGGVIQIFTRHGTGQHVSIGVGNHNTYQAAGGWSDEIDNFFYSLQGSYLNSEGVNTCEGNLTAGCFTVEPDKDGYDNTSFSSKIGYQFNQSTQLEATALSTQANNQYDSSFNNESDIVQQVFGVKLTTHPQDFWESQFNIGRSIDEMENIGHAPMTYFDQNRDMFGWQNNFLLENAIITIGYDYQKDKISRSTTDYIVTERDNHGIFAEYQTQLGEIDAVIGLRHDKNQQFGTHDTGNISFGYAIDPNWRAFTAYGTAFKAPSFNQLYYPNYGNSLIKPEKADSLELGITGQHGENQFTANLFHSRIKDMIGGYPIDNFEKAKISGIELADQWSSSDWELIGQFSWLDAENDMTQKKLPYRSEYKGYLAITRIMAQTRFTIDFLAQSHRFDDASNSQKLSGYSVFNARSEYQYDKNWVMRLRLDNIFSRDYQTIRAYPMPKRTIFLQLEYTL